MQKSDNELVFYQGEQPVNKKKGYYSSRYLNYGEANKWVIYRMYPFKSLYDSIIVCFISELHMVLH